MYCTQRERVLISVVVMGLKSMYISCLEMTSPIKESQKYSD